MMCLECERGEKKTVPGNGLTEPPYIEVIRCPFDNKYYHSPFYECTFTEQLQSMAKLTDFENLHGRWFDDATYVMEWDGGKDADGDEFHYQLEWQTDSNVLIFSRVYEDQTIPLNITANEKAMAMKRLAKLILGE